MAFEIPTVEKVFDPNDEDYVLFDFSDELETGETIVIASLQTFVDLASATAGVRVMTGPYSPTTDGRRVQIWLTVQIVNQTDVVFDEGIVAQITLTFSTSVTLPRTLQRSFFVRFQNR